MSKKYDEIQEEPLMTAEPVATYGLRTGGDMMSGILERDMTPEELSGIFADDINAIYEMEDNKIIGIKEAGKMTHAAICGGHATLDLEAMRENLHQMVREVYSKP